MFNRLTIFMFTLIFSVSSWAEFYIIGGASSASAYRATSLSPVVSGPYPIGNRMPVKADKKRPSIKNAKQYSPQPTSY